jgi:uncharacterized protein (DUF697 family)
MNAQTHTDAQNLIQTHVLIAMGAGLVPFPVLDIAAVTAVQLDMLRSLSKLYGQNFYEAPVKSLIAALAGSTLARIAASALKVIPGVGTLLGGVSMSIMSGASTYAVGQVFAQHFNTGGSIEDFDPLQAKGRYEEELGKGKKAAAEWKKQKEQESSASKEDDVLKKLEKLGELKEKGILTEEEFQKMKGQLIGQL